MDSARKTAASSYSKASSGAGLTQIPANEKRVALIVGCPVVAGVVQPTRIIFGSSSDTNAGVVLSGGTSVIRLSDDDIGTAVQDAVQLQDVAGGAQTHAWVEIVLAP